MLSLATDPATEGWAYLGYDRWERRYGDGHVGEVYAIAAQLWTGQLRRPMPQYDASVGTNYRRADDAKEAVDEIHQRCVAPA